MPSYNLTPSLGYETKKDAQNKANKDLSNVPQAAFAAKMAEGGMGEIAEDIAAVKTDTTAIKTDTSNLKTTTATVNSKLDNSTYGLDALNKKIADVSSKLTNSTYGLNAIQNNIGTSANTGGSASAGTLMAKVNWLINTVNTIKSVNSRYTPIETVKKTLLNTEVSDNTNNNKLIAKFMPDKDGVVRLRVRTRITKAGSNEYGHILIGVLSNTPSGTTDTSNSYPECQMLLRYLDRTSLWDESGIASFMGNYINYNLPLGTIKIVVQEYDYYAGKRLYRITSNTYTTVDIGIQLIKGIPLMVYMGGSPNNPAYCNLVQLLYEEV